MSCDLEGNCLFADSRVFVILRLAVHNMLVNIFGVTGVPRSCRTTLQAASFCGILHGMCLFDVVIIYLVLPVCILAHLSAVQIFVHLVG